MSTQLPPVPAASGEQHEIAYGDQHAIVVEVGGGLRAYSVGGRDIFAGYAADAVADGARGQTLIPWPNRLGDGRYSFGGEDFQAPLNEPDKRNALHGFVRWESFGLAERDESTVSLVHRLHARDSYPFTLDIRNTYALGPEGLTVTTTVVNAGRGPLPYGVGFHPYVTVGTDLVNEVVLQLPADTYLPTDDRQLPTGEVSVAGTAYDFREARAIGDTQIDFAFSALERDHDGRARARLVNPSDGWTVEFWVDEGFPYLEVFTSDTLTPPRRSLGLEPMSCPPNGLQSGDGVRVVDPGESVVTRWGLSGRFAD